MAKVHLFLVFYYNKCWHFTHSAVCNDQIEGVGDLMCVYIDFPFIVKPPVLQERSFNNFHTHHFIFSMRQLFTSRTHWQYFFISRHKVILYLFHIIPVSPFSPFSPFLPSLPSLPGIPTFPSAPGGPLGPGLPGSPGDPGTLQISRGALSLVSNNSPETQGHRQTNPIKVHIFKPVYTAKREH